LQSGPEAKADMWVKRSELHNFFTRATVANDTDTGNKIAAARCITFITILAGEDEVREESEGFAGREEDLPRRKKAHAC
jgi:hypothetical protein